jgi:hypothetical protein
MGPGSSRSDRRRKRHRSVLLVRGMPTALDNGQRCPRKLLAAVVRRLLAALSRKD